MRIIAHSSGAGSLAKDATVSTKGFFCKNTVEDEANRGDDRDGNYNRPNPGEEFGDDSQCDNRGDDDQTKFKASRHLFLVPLAPVRKLIY